MQAVTVQDTSTFIVPKGISGGKIGLQRSFPIFLTWHLNSAAPLVFAVVTVDNRTEMDTVPMQLKGGLPVVGTRPGAYEVNSKRLTQVSAWAC